VSCSRGAGSRPRRPSRCASGASTITLFDEDTGVFDDDDKLGVVTVTESQIGQGQQTGKFTGDGANYTLYYTVKPA
jgi:hypothetical protein